ncbi:hypothetical protein [Quatrionicoccus australiensis]|uniref:hypothetical protein n=1 Tax=Quatrionicoccus australiensis TaxID=138118 RepID=UPI001CFA3723|nr:hypothetical protein [Quatrionicoccus australiensis]MCB4360913.1 hypothetical protein [Quatrionicoccus australiensis]
MRTALLIALFCLCIGRPAVAASIQQDIAEADRLNSLCRGGSGDSAATAKHCEKRDAAYAAIERRGWCWGHEGQAGNERQWEKCQQSNGEATPEPKPYSAMFLAMHKDVMLKEQRQQCEDMGIAAGDQKGAARCLNYLERAYSYMRRQAYEVAIPAVGWSICMDKAAYDIDLGARCIAAAKEICKADENGTAMDYSQCVRIMTNGAWVTTPAARALRF